MKSRLPAKPVLVGRDLEIKLLRQHLDSALNGKGTTVLICGEAGVGKTRLVNEFLNLAKKRGIKILKGWCLSGAVPPYFPFTEAFNTYMSTISDDKAKSAMTKHLGITGWLKGPEFTREFKARELFSTPKIERDRTFEAVARVFLQLSVKEPIILFLDDLHWADHLSLALLHYLSRKCRNSRLLIIGTYRLEEIIPTKEERLHPLQETMFSMSREDLLIKMDLNRLKRDDFPELLKSIFRSSIEEEFVEKLYEETEGNPLFVLETLNMLVAEGFISEKQGRWMLMAPMEKIGIPSKVQEVIVRRIRRLRREERKLLDLAVVCGYSFSPDTLSRTLALDITDVLETLVEIEEKHRLIRSTDSTFEFTHQKIREVMYSNLPSELRRIYHLKTASCLEQVLAEKISDNYLANIALHYVEGGAPEKAFEYLVKLSEKAVNIYAYVQAIEYLSKALEATQKNVNLATNENLAKIYKLRGIAWRLQDERTKAINDFNLTLQNATNINDESMIAEAHYWLGSTYEPWFGQMDEAMRHLKKAVEMARKTGNRRLEGRSLGKIGSALMWGATLDTMDEGRMRLEESSRISKEIGDKVTDADNLWSLGMYHNWKGDFHRAKENMSKALELAEEAGGIPTITGILYALSIVLGGNGEYNDAISTGQRCLQLARDSGLWTDASIVLNTLGWIHHDLSSIELALKYNNKSIETARAHQKSLASGAVPVALMNLGMDYLYKNDYENAEKHFKEASSLTHQHPGGWWRNETHILLGRGEISLAKGDYIQALKYAEDLLALSEKAGAKKYIAKGLKLKAEVLAKMDKTEEAIELMENALKLAQQVGNPPLLWQIHYSLGLLLEKRGNPQKANEHHAEAIALIEATASKLNDASLTNGLLTAPMTRAIRDAYSARAGLITTGCADVDNLLLGGIPKNYAVILTSPSCDERDLLIRRFLEAGAKEGQVTFYITTRTSGLKNLAEGFQSNFYIFVCNPQADKIMKSLPNVFKLKGVENLTDINIALTSAFRRLDASPKRPRRACIGIISDVLLQHHAVQTRRWLNALVPELKSKGFTTLAVMNPKMHPPEEVQAVLDLFEGEISIYEKEAKKDSGKFIRIEKMYRQRYLDSGMPLRKERLKT